MVAVGLVYVYSAGKPLIVTHKSYSWTPGLFCLRGKTAAFQSLRDKGTWWPAFSPRKQPD